MADTDVSNRIEEIADDFHLDPHGHYARWRERGPVHRVRFPNGVACWLITGYAEGRAALADSRLRKDSTQVHRLLADRRDSSEVVNADAAALATHMLNSDPPDHTRLRKLVSKAFTPRRVAALRPRIEEISAQLLDDMFRHDEVDLLATFANPLPVTVICELLGVPYDDRDEFQAWARAIVGGVGGVAERNAASVEMSVYLRDLVSAKRVHPADDLLSGLVHIHDDGDRLSEQELVSMVHLLLIAGHETTVNLIGNGTYALLRDRPQFDALRADLSRVPAAVEEFLRYDGPVGWATVRYTAEAVEIAGVTVPEQEIVYVAVDAGNRDPARYDHAERLDVAANSSGHLGFGHGIHFCVGAPLARLEAEVAFTQLLQRFPGLRVRPGFDAQRNPGMLIRGLRELPVRPRG